MKSKTLGLTLLMGLLFALIVACDLLFPDVQELVGLKDKPQWDYLTKGWEEDRATVYFDSTVAKNNAANLAQWRHERNKGSAKKTIRSGYSI